MSEEVAYRIEFNAVNRDIANVNGYLFTVYGGQIPILHYYNRSGRNATCLLTPRAGHYFSELEIEAAKEFASNCGVLAKITKRLKGET